MGHSLKKDNKQPLKTCKKSHNSKIKEPQVDDLSPIPTDKVKPVVYTIGCWLRVYDLSLFSASLLYFLYANLITLLFRLDCLTDYWFNVGAYLSLRMSECVNPVLYNLASKKMRKASLNVLNNLR